MATRVGGTIGQQIDLLIKQGSDLIVDLEVVLEPGQSLNLNDYTFPAHLRKKPGGTPLRAISVTRFAANMLRVFLDHAQTATLTCGADLDDDASQYVWDCEIVETATGLILPAFFGDVQVFRDIRP